LFVIVGVANFFDTALAVVFASLILFLMMHRLFWPTLARSIFRLQDTGTKGRRKPLTVIGVMLIALGIGLPNWLKEFLLKML
jgi:uncharacterized membrane protein YhaH (DUF805 family)